MLQAKPQLAADSTDSIAARGAGGGGDHAQVRGGPGSCVDLRGAVVPVAHCLGRGDAAISTSIGSSTAMRRRTAQPANCRRYPDAAMIMLER